MDCFRVVTEVSGELLHRRWWIPDWRCCCTIPKAVQGQRL